jgi:hypothetical protein
MDTPMLILVGVVGLIVFLVVLAQPVIGTAIVATIAVVGLFLRR